jgi:hypothetical protein
LTKSLHDDLGAEQPRTAPDPETAEERTERLSRRRGFQIAGLAALLIVGWEVLQWVGHARGHGVVGALIVLAIGALAVIGGIGGLWNEDDEGHDD